MLLFLVYPNFYIWKSIYSSIFEKIKRKSMTIKKEYIKNKSQCKITFPPQKNVADGATLTIKKQYLKNKSQCRITFPAQ